VKTNNYISLLPIVYQIGDIMDEKKKIQNNRNLYLAAAVVLVVAALGGGVIVFQNLLSSTGQDVVGNAVSLTKKCSTLKTLTSVCKSPLDPGTSNYNNAGCAYCTGNPNVNYCDRCANDKTLVETYCTLDVYSKTYTCPGKCRGGKCV
jgi:hypothetical protein